MLLTSIFDDLASLMESTERRGHAVARAGILNALVRGENPLATTRLLKNTFRGNLIFWERGKEKRLFFPKKVFLFPFHALHTSPSLQIVHQGGRAPNHVTLRLSLPDMVATVYSSIDHWRIYIDI
jgi:hypothetical protein